MREEFTNEVKRAISARVGSRCSRPTCRALTSGPQVDPSKSLNVGVAAHITAASAGGPRYNPLLSSDERRDATNAIWLCQTCAKLVDNDTSRFSESELRGWKERAEDEALQMVGLAAEYMAPVITKSESMTLANYIESVSKFVIDLTTNPGQSVLEAIVTAKTLAVLPELGPYGKLQLMMFLKSADLITASRPIVRLNRADLTGAFLRKMDLSGLDLSEANLKGALLDRCNFRGSQLQNACLENAVLEWSDISHANLSGTCLRGARLLEVSFKDSIMIGADLTDAMVIGTWWNRSRMSPDFGHHANFEGANLADAKGLDVESLCIFGLLKNAVLPNGLVADSCGE